MTSTKIELQPQETEELSSIVRKFLGDGWDFELSEGKPKIYAYPDFDRKRIVLCDRFLNKQGYEASRKLILHMVAVQLAVRKTGSATKPAITTAFDFMGVPKTDRMKVSLGRGR
ncbi:MAG: hypothetical protein K2Y22_02100 [Candidatus Obscuribacterales bacterium]|nr:hypothetical protein [Candidatus Obscuribacterales bacterium]